MSEALMQVVKASQEMIPLERCPDRELFPLSMNQRDMWLQSQIHDQQGLNNVCVQVTLDGPLNTNLFRLAWQAVVDRHEALRTVFVEVEDVPQQKVLPAVQVTFSVQDVSGKSAADQSMHVKAVEQQLLSKQFDYSLGPLFDFALLQFHERRYVFLFAFNHLILDGIHMSRIFEQVGASYEALLKGGSGSLPELEVQYPDFAAHQDELLNRGLLTEHEAYWREQLRAPLPAMELPTDRDSHRVNSFDLGVLDRNLPDKVFQQLKNFRRRYRTTLFRTVLAAFEVLLQDLVGERELLLGMPVSTLPKHRPELLGFFGHLVPVRTDLDGTARFTDVLADVNRQVRQAQDHTQYPLFAAVQGLKISRDPQRPLFPVVISQVKRLEAEMGGVRMNMVSDVMHGGVYHLWLKVRELTDGLSLGYSYNRNLLTGRPISLIADCLEELLSRIAAQPEALLSHLEVLPSEERQRVLNFGDGRRCFREGPCVEERIKQIALEHPHAPAVKDRNGDLSYRELQDQTNCLANWLRFKGIQCEDTVGIMGRRSVGMMTAILGVMKAGAAYVPLDRNDPQDRLLGMMRDARLKLLAVDRESAELGRRLATASGCEILSWDGERVEGVVGRCEWGLSSREEAECKKGAPNSLAYIFYTSGSTGVPKGAMVERAGMLNHLEAKIELLELGRGDVVAQTASHCFDISVWQFLAALLVGGRVVIYDDELVSNPAALLEALKQDGVTILEIIPSYLELLLGMEEVEKLACLRYLISTAETLSVSLSKRWVRRFPGVPLVNTWGTTECSDDVTHEALHAEMERKQRVGVGRPIKGSRVYVLNKHSGLAPVGCVGEICVGGVCVGRGYVGDAARTAARFVPDPFEQDPGGRLYLTGDMGRWRWDGGLEFLGRRDGQVKLRGRRIEIAEIEAVLLGYPAIGQVVVAAHEGQLLAYWTGNPALDLHELRRYVAKRLPEHMVPDTFMHLVELPLTRTGKIDRRSLPTPDWNQRREKYVGPRTEMETRIAEIWREVLSGNRIGVCDNFFEIGGNSLNATQIVLKLQALAGPEVSVRHLFLNPTISELAIALTALGSAEKLVEKIPAIGQKAVYSLAPTQQPMWLTFSDVLEMGGPGWGFPQVIRVDGDIDPEIFGKALDALVERHESLRVSFLELEGQPGQVVHEQVRVPWHLHDLSSLPDEQQPARLRLILAEQLSAPLANRPPMIRVQLVRLAANHHSIVIQLPHIISDAWTERILAEDLAELYSSFKEKRTPSLPELHVRYLDYAAWHQKRLESPALQAQKAYWLSRFSGDFEALHLEAVSSGAAEEPLERERVSLPNELMQRLKRLAADQRCTLFVVLLAAFQSLLARLTGSTDIVVGTAASGRTHSDLERVAGLFINPLCLRSDLSGNPTFVELLGRVRETVLEAMAYQDYPFQQWLHALRRKQGRADFYPYSLVLMLEERPKDLRFAGAKAFFESLPSWGFDLPKVAGPMLSVRVFEGRESWCAEIMPGALDKSGVLPSPAPRSLLARWSRLLREIAEHPETRLGLFNLQQEDEQHRLWGLNSASDIDPRLVEMVRVFKRAGCRGFVGLNADGVLLDETKKNSFSPGLLQGNVFSGHLKVLAASLAVLKSLAPTGNSLKQVISHLEHVIVPALAASDCEFFSGAGLHLSAFVPLDESADAILWIDNFQPGLPLAGRPSGGYSLHVLDEWGNLAPMGVRGRIFKKSLVDETSAEMVPLPWSGRWRWDGLLEINARQFRTIELEVEELQEFLRR